MPRNKDCSDETAFIRALAKTGMHFAPDAEAFCAELARAYLGEKGTSELMPETEDVSRGTPLRRVLGGYLATKLAKNSVLTVGDLTALTETKLAILPGIHTGTVRKIVAKLAVSGLHLKLN